MVYGCISVLQLCVVVVVVFVVLQLCLVVVVVVVVVLCRPISLPEFVVSSVIESFGCSQSHLSVALGLGVLAAHTHTLEQHHLSYRNRSITWFLYLLPCSCVQPYTLLFQNIDIVER